MFLLIDLPKPVHGMSNVNLEVLKRSPDGAVFINTAPSYASSFYGTIFWPFIKLTHSFGCFLLLFYYLATHKGGGVYRSINGGFGQVYDIFYVFLSRVFGRKIIIHHHSFSYLNKKSFLFKLVKFVSGADAVHVVLGERMGKILSSLYGISSGSILEVSNIAFFETGQEPSRIDNDIITIGYLANVSLEKGVDFFAQTCFELTQLGVPFQAVIAGPFSDGLSEAVVNRLTSEIDSVKYVGPLYGIQKDDFFKSIDIFLFPSVYKNEAEPLVLYEAAQHGVYLMGSDSGCMGSVIQSFDGYFQKKEEMLASNFAKKILNLRNNLSLSEENRSLRKERFIFLQSKAQEALKRLILIASSS